jgi:hypothetical protein
LKLFQESGEGEWERSRGYEFKDDISDTFKNFVNGITYPQPAQQ